MSNVKDAVGRFEELLKVILKKLESIENKLKLLGSGSNEVMIVSEILSLLSVPVSVAAIAAKRFLDVTKAYRLDPISMDIVKILSICEGYSTSEITRRLRDLRGSASRRVVRERLRILEEKGIVVNKGSLSRPRFMLRKCFEEPKRLTS